MSLRPSERAEIRHKGYKASVDAGEGRRRRHNATVEIRKTDRDRALNEKRQRPDAVPLAAHSSALEKKLDSLPSLAQGVYSDDSSMQLEATTQFRKLLSIELCPPIEEVISSGVVPRFVQFLTREDYYQLQMVQTRHAAASGSGTPMSEENEQTPGGAVPPQALPIGLMAAQTQMMYTMMNQRVAVVLQLFALIFKNQSFVD